MNVRLGLEEENILRLVYKAALRNPRKALVGIDGHTYQELGLDAQSFNAKVKVLIKAGLLHDLTGIVGAKYSNVEYCSLGLTPNGKVYCEHYELA